MKSLNKKQLRLLFFENYALVTFYSRSEFRVLYNGEIEGFSYLELMKEFSNLPIYIFIDNIDTNFLTISVKNLTLFHIFQLKKRILQENKESVVSIVKRKKNLYVTKVGISPAQKKLIEELQSCSMLPVNISALASSLFSMHPNTPSITIQTPNGSKKMFMYESGIPTGIKFVNESQEIVTTPLQALEKISFKKNHLTCVIQAYQSTVYLKWLKNFLWICIFFFLSVTLLAFISQTKKYNEIKNLNLEESFLMNSLNNTPQLEIKKRELICTLPKISTLASLENKKINPIFLFKMAAIILKPIKISLAQFYIDEKDILHLSFSVIKSDLNKNMLKNLQHVFPPPIEIKVEKKTHAESLVHIFGNPSLFKNQPK